MMAKAVLVMDMPESCVKCNMVYTFGFHVMCWAKHKRLEGFVISSCRPDWCPLKPMPEKVIKSIHDSDETWFWNQGWNACIDKILGEEGKIGGRGKVASNQ